LNLSRAFRLEPGTGWQINPRILHAPGSLVTYEPQVNSDVFAMFQSEVDGRIVPWELLTKDVPKEHHHDLDYLVDMLDWDANVNPEFAKSNRVFPCPVRQFAETEDAGYRVQWVCYGTGYYSAQEATALPKRAAVGVGGIIKHTHPRIHNAMWPGLVGKGSPGAEPAIDLDTMLDVTAKASVDGAKFDGVDLFLFDPHVSIDATDSDLKRLADKIASKGFVVGSLVAPVWPPTGGGSAMGSEEDRRNFVTQVRKACAIGRKLRGLGIRKYGVVRIDSAASPAEWARDPDANTKRIADTFSRACDVAEDYGERLAAEG